MLKQCLNGLSLLIVLTVLTGVVYPLTMTGLAQVVFPVQANGSLLERDGKVIGSVLIGQTFSQPGYFHGRPSAAGQEGYDATSSSGTNLGPTSAKLMEGIKGKLEEVRQENNLEANARIPADLVTSSGSGLDPDISLEGAYIQVGRVAQERHMSADQVKNLVEEHAKRLQLGFLGEKRVNVLEINLALDKQL